MAYESQSSLACVQKGTMFFAMRPKHLEVEIMPTLDSVAWSRGSYKDACWTVTESRFGVGCEPLRVGSLLENAPKKIKQL